MGFNTPSQWFLLGDKIWEAFTLGSSKSFGPFFSLPLLLTEPNRPLIKWGLDTCRFIVLIPSIPSSAFSSVSKLLFIHKWRSRLLVCVLSPGVTRFSARALPLGPACGVAQSAASLPASIPRPIPAGLTSVRVPLNSEVSQCLSLEGGRLLLESSGLRGEVGAESLTQPSA